MSFTHEVRHSGLRSTWLAILLTLLLVAIAASFAPQAHAAILKTTITSGPTGFTADNTPTFTFKSSDARATFRCAVDSGSYATCTSPATTAALTDGSHTFYVRSVRPGLIDRSGASRSFIVDTKAPVFSAATCAVTGASVTCSWSATDSASGISGYKCQLDTEVATSCTSPTSRTGLSLGAHVFNVTATDAVGNAFTRTVSFSVQPPPDTEAPVVTITSPASGAVLTVSSVAVAFTFTDNFGPAGVTCDHTSGDGVNLDQGSNTISVSCTDAAGNTGAATVTVTFSPLAVVGYKQVSVGRLTTCALYQLDSNPQNTNVRCWGFNDRGQLGNGTSTDSSSPVTVLSGPGGPPLTGVKSISTGSYHVCALMFSGVLKCWGWNTDGTLGVGYATTTGNGGIPYPTTVVAGPGSTDPLLGVREVSAGAATTCVLLESGGAKCWGYNADGRVGDNTTVDRYAPADVVTSATDSTPLSGITRLSNGAYHACAVVGAAGNVLCWGDNAYDQINDQMGVHALAPTQIYLSGGTSGTPLTGATDVVAGGWWSCVRMSDATGKCWGLNSTGYLGVGHGVGTAPSFEPNPQPIVTAHGGTTAFAPITNLTQASHCAISAGSLSCWGPNENGQLGDGTTVPKDFANAVLSGPGSTTQLSGVLDADAGTSTVCALLTDATLRCWGDNQFGTVGDGTTIDRTTPVPVG